MPPASACHLVGWASDAAPALGGERYLELMRVDKKAEAGEIRFIVLEAPGRAVLRAVPDSLVKEVIAARAD